MSAMHSCHILLGGRDRPVSQLRLDELASVRLRSYPAGLALEEAGWAVSSGDHVPKHVNTVIVGKIPSSDLENRAPHWISELKEVKRRGGEVVIDYTDHHLDADHYLGVESAKKPFYQEAFEIADRCVVSHNELSKELQTSGACHGSKIQAIEDHIEYEIREPREPSDDPANWSAIWFGHGTNFDFLMHLCASWPESAPRNLYIVSSEEVHDFIRSGKLYASRPLQIHFCEWSPSALAKAAMAADIAIIPSSFKSRKQFASSNRLATSLILGLPTVATPIPSYREFEEYFFELGTPSATALFENPRLGHEQVRHFQDQFASRFSLASLKGAWLNNITGA